MAERPGAPRSAVWPCPGREGLPRTRGCFWLTLLSPALASNEETHDSDVKGVRLLACTKSFQEREINVHRDVSIFALFSYCEGVMSATWAVCWGKQRRRESGLRAALPGALGGVCGARSQLSRSSGASGAGLEPPPGARGRLGAGLEPALQEPGGALGAGLEPAQELRGVWGPERLSRSSGAVGGKVWCSAGAAV